MQPEAMFVGDRPQGPQIVQWDYRPAPSVVRILHTDQRSPGDVGRRLSDIAFHFLWIHGPSAGRERPWRDPGDKGHMCRFHVIDVRAGLDDDLVQFPSPDLDGDRIPHRARRHVQGGLFAHDLHRQGFELLDSGVIAQDIIPDNGFRHGLPHLFCGLGDGIASKIRYRAHRARSFNGVENIIDKKSRNLNASATFRLFT